MSKSTAAALGLVVLLAGCSSDSPAGSPADVTDGSYTLFATSSSKAPDAAVSLTVAGDSVELTQGGDTVQATLGEAGDTKYTLCPPGGEGSPLPLDMPVEVGSVKLDQPALFGDCGQTKPVRVTLVDLAATNEQAFPFATWIEFCDTTDPDC